MIDDTPLVTLTEIGIAAAAVFVVVCLLLLWRSERREIQRERERAERFDEEYERITRELNL